MTGSCGTGHDPVPQPSGRKEDIMDDGVRLTAAELIAIALGTAPSGRAGNATDVPGSDSAKNSTAPSGRAGNGDSDQESGTHGTAPSGRAGNGDSDQESGTKPPP